MNRTRILVIFGALFAAIATAFLVQFLFGSDEEVIEEQVIIEEPDRILVVARDMSAGQRLDVQDMAWVEWPDESLLEYHIIEDIDSDAIDRLAGSIVRGSLYNGEPLNEQNLVLKGESGFMAAILTNGMRAIAVPVSAEHAAGGFILPNDRVDVIASFNEDFGYSTGVIVENSRVLAIDQTSIDESEGAIVGTTATIEVTIAQARAISEAMTIGTISLALRSVANMRGGPRLAPRAPAVVKIYRYGKEERTVLGGAQ